MIDSFVEEAEDDDCFENDENVSTDESDESDNDIQIDYNSKNKEDGIGNIIEGIEATREEIESMNKKRKRNGKKLNKAVKWSEEESKLLRESVIKISKETGDDKTGLWARVAKLFKDKSSKHCRERWKSVEDPRINRSEWTMEEDIKILKLHKIHGTSWSLISKELDRRPELSVKTRCISLKRAQARFWTAKEDAILLLLYQIIGQDWVSIAKHLPGRKNNALRSRIKLIQTYSHRLVPSLGDPAQTIPFPTVDELKEARDEALKIAKKHFSHIKIPEQFTTFNDFSTGLSFPVLRSRSYLNSKRQRRAQETNTADSPQLFDEIIDVDSTKSTSTSPPIIRVTQKPSNSNINFSTSKFQKETTASDRQERAIVPRAEGNIENKSFNKRALLLDGNLMRNDHMPQLYGHSSSFSSISTPMILQQHQTFKQFRNFKNDSSYPSSRLKAPSLDEISLVNRVLKEPIHESTNFVQSQSSIINETYESSMNTSSTSFGIPFVNSLRSPDASFESTEISNTSGSFPSNKVEFSFATGQKFTLKQ